MAKKAKEAKVEIVLPDGTKISARGPMAEQMARRLMDPQWHYYWPTYTWTSLGGGVTYQATNAPATTDVQITYSGGAVPSTYTVSDAAATAISQAIEKGIGRA